MAAAHEATLGHYLLLDPIASGGMGTVHFGRLVAPLGFSRIVAIKRLGEHLAREPALVDALADEARIAARIRHPNVVPMLDVFTSEGELSLVMEYVHGESVATLFKLSTAQGSPIPLGVAVAIAIGALHGLHAAHEAMSERGKPLGIVHRDVSPQNILVGVDGIARVADFGIAKAAGRLQTTGGGLVKGKPAYMAPEQLAGEDVDRRADIYAASVVLWELLAGKRLFARNAEVDVLRAIIDRQIDRPSRHTDLPPALDAIVMRGLSFDPDNRFPTALAMALELEETIDAPRLHEIGTWVSETAHESLGLRAERMAEIERSSEAMIAAADQVAASDEAAFDKNPGHAHQVDATLGLATTRLHVSDSKPTAEIPHTRRRAIATWWKFAAGLAGLIALSYAASWVIRRQGSSRETITTWTDVKPSAAPIQTGPTTSATQPTIEQRRDLAITVTTPTTSTRALTTQVALPIDSAKPASRERPATSSAIAPNPSAPSAGSTVVNRPPPIDCDPPFVIDSSGLKIPKRECMRGR